MVRIIRFRAVRILLGGSNRGCVSVGLVRI
jgi:hypothetical protein